ncbi:MAG TPA: MOSC N-terminal beta barrel domain-containing protein [Solirubrobacteraceae bacterium]
MRHSGTISELWRYPVKSMAGEPVDALRVDWRGAGGDRTHALHFEHKGAPKRLTVREAPRMLGWRAGYGPQTDVAPEHPPLARLTGPDGRAYDWDDPALPDVLAADLGRPLTLRRDVEGQQDLGRSLLLTFEASRRALEDELGTAIDLRRFRPNLHLDLDAPAWAEESWEGGRLELEGGVVLRLLHPCERCVIPTRHPDTHAKWPELLKHLSREHGTNFGINARVEVPGELRRGYSAWTSDSTSETDALASPNSSAVFSS